MGKNKSFTLFMFAILLAAFLISVNGLAKAPQPFCKSKPLYHQFPMIQNQTLSHDMSTSFSGYNLQIKLKSNNSFANIHSKLTKLDQNKIPIPGIISHKVQRNGNSWGKSSFILFKDNQGIKLTYGHFQNQGQLPKLNYTINVTNASNTTCFDAALFFDSGIAMVDCMEEDNTALFDRYKNYYYYIDLTNHKVIGKAYNHLMVGFQQITKRKVLVYTNKQSGEIYFLRAYFTNGVDFGSRLNTFMEIYLASDPKDLQLLSVIDRTFLHLKSLAIIDVKIYLDDIFFLDPYNGLYRLDILKNQQVAITGRYNKQGFTKFAVYSDDLQNEVLIGLANNHSIYQIDWHKTNDPILVNKYSLMEQSKVTQFMFNDRFLVVQSQSIAQDDRKKQLKFYYTWVFTKGSRTFSHAHLVINHKNNNVQFQLNRQNDQLIIADSQGLTLYLLDEARLYLNHRQPGKIGTFQQVVIEAVSTDPNTKDIQKCQESFTVYFVNQGNFSLWKTGIQPPASYSFNYPGQLHLDLDQYVMGPLVQYGVKNSKDDKLPPYWINKVNKTTFSINENISPGDITFFYTQVIPHLGKQSVIYYYQESNNVTKVADCLHLWEAAKMSCRVLASHAHNSHILHFTSAYFVDEQGWNYFYIFTLQGNKKGLYIIDYNKHQRIAQINYLGDLDAIIGGLAASNGYLYVLLPYVKTINVYKLSTCQELGQCRLQFKIDAMKMKNLGVDYFAPKQIITDRAHPQVLFIKCLGTMVIVDIDNKQQITLLDQITSTATKDEYYKVAVNRWRMVLVAQPNLIEEYSLQFIYVRNHVYLVKNIPAYGFIFPPTADIEFSDMSDTVYINANDPSTNKTVVLIYRPGYPGVTTLYQQLKLDKLYSRPELQIQVSGFYVNFLSIKTGNSFNVYRVFAEPWLSIKDAARDFEFDLTYSNPVSSTQSKPVSVSVVNLPTGFIPTQQFNQTMNNVKVDTHGNYTWKDRKWFDGHIINYNYSCQQCPPKQQPKVRLREHIDTYRQLHVGSNQYIETFSGGVSVWNDIFRWNINGTVKSVHNIPAQNLSQQCNKITSTYDDLFVVTACIETGRGANIYVTSLASHKGFTWGPYRSDSFYARNIKLVQDVLMIVDTSAYPQYKFYEGAIFLYQMSLDGVTGQQMDQLQVIDSNDLLAAHGWDQDTAYLGNADLIYSLNTKSWRLYVTQISSGFFVIDFTKKNRDTQINIVTTQFVDMKALLVQHGFHMPNDASFQAIVRTKQVYNPAFDVQNVVVTTKGYDNFQVTLIWDDTGHLVSTVIHRVYYRYAYYQTFNEVRSVPGYLAIGYLIPPIYEYYTNYTRQIIAVYDTSDYQHQSQKGYSQRYMISGFTLRNSAGAMFNFNTTYDHQSNGTRVGIVVADPIKTALYHGSISKDLTLQFKKDFKNQQLSLTPYNDFYSFTFNVTLINPDDQEAQEILIIIIVILCALITIFFSGYVIILIRRKKKQNQQSQQRQSLLTQEESILNRQSMDPRVQKQGQNKSRSSSSSSSSEGSSQENQQEKNQGQGIQRQAQQQQLGQRQKEVNNENNNQKEQNQPVKVEQEGQKVENNQQQEPKVENEAEQKKQDVKQ